MPPRLHTTYYQATKGEILLLLGCALFWIGVYFTGLFACIIYNPVVHENKTALILGMIVIIGGGLGQAAFVLFYLFHCLRYRLIFDEHGITRRGMLSEQSIDLCDVMQLEWKWLKNRQRYRIDLQTPAVKIAMSLDLLKSQPAHRNALICFLRETIPRENQFGWEEFREYIERSPQKWHPDGKNHVPVVAEDEFLVTRKDILRGSRPLLLINVVMIILAYVAGRFDLAARGAAKDSVWAPLMLVILVELPMLGWACSFGLCPKHGRKWKKSQRKQLAKTGWLFMALGVMFQLMLLLMVFEYRFLLPIKTILIVACYVLLHFGSREIKKATELPIPEERPECDIPEVLRAAKTTEI